MAGGEEPRTSGRLSRHPVRLAAHVRPRRDPAIGHRVRLHDGFDLGADLLAQPPDGDPMAGVLIYTAAPDSEGNARRPLCPRRTGQTRSALRPGIGQDEPLCVGPACAEHRSRRSGDAARGILPRLLVPARDVVRAGQQVPGSFGIGSDRGAERPGILRATVMDNSHNHIVEAAVRLAAQVPRPTVDAVATILEEPGGLRLPSVKTRITQNIPQSHYRGLVTGFLDQWLAKAPEVPTASVAVALRTAAHAEEVRRKGQSVEFVSTGPEAEAAPFRHTEQAILQVLDSAEQTITLVSYAVYRIPHIREALVRAAGRGVQLRVVVETPHKMEGQNECSRSRLGELV